MAATKKYNDSDASISFDGSLFTRYPFEIDSSKVIIPSFMLTVKEFKALYDRDKTKDKEQALSEFSYIAHSEDVRSPYREMQDEHRKQTLKQEYLAGKEPDRLVAEAQKKYSELCNTRPIKLLKAAYSGCDKLMEYFHSVDLNEVDEQGKLVNKATDLARNLKEVGGIVEALKKIEELVKQDLSFQKAKIRGNAEVSEWEK